MKVVAIKDMSAGNESIGEMWQETKIFELETPVINILQWVIGDKNVSPTKKRITITIADEDFN